MSGGVSRRQVIQAAIIGLGGMIGGCTEQSQNGNGLSTPIGFSSNSTSPTTASKNSTLTATKSDLNKETHDKSTSETKTIPILKSGEDSIRSDNVPKDWYEYMEKVKKANRVVQERYQDMPGVRSIGIGKSEKEVGGEPVSKVVVNVNPNKVKHVRKVIPSRVNGVIVDIKPVGEINPA